MMKLTKRLLLIPVLATAMGLATMGSAFAVVTSEGPYGTSTFTDYGTCGNAWANLTTSTTYKVSPVNNDGSYNVKAVVAGHFVSLAGQSLGACDTGSDNGNKINAGAKGRIRLVFFLTVKGGVFDPTATCDAGCSTDYSYNGINDFVLTFFGGSATWAFSTVRDAQEIVNSGNTALCANSFTGTFPPAGGPFSSASGDIATTCVA